MSEQSQSAGRHAAGRGRCRWPRAAALIAGLLLAFVAAPAARATGFDALQTTAPATTAIAANATTTVSGASVTDATNPGAMLLVTLSTSAGTLTLPSSSGLTLAYGESTFSGSAFSFTGDESDVNAALAGLQLTGAGGEATAQITVNATVSVPGIVYDPTDGHFFQYVSDPSDNWTDAEADALAMTFDGQPGYLAAVPDAATEQFVTTILSGDYNVWAGGTATNETSALADGVWRIWNWVNTPYGSAPFTQCTNLTGACLWYDTDPFFQGLWASGEPANANGTETALEIAYSPTGTAVGATSTWNDLNPTSPHATGYLVEYGNHPFGASQWLGQSTSTAAVALATAPGQPTGVTTTPVGPGQVAVSWTAPADSGGTAITSYTVTATAPDGTTVTCTSTATSCRFSGLEPGVTYSFTVIATNPIASSAPTAPAQATVPTATGTVTTPASGAAALAAAARRLGVTTSPSGHFPIVLDCPSVTDGCTVDGTLAVTVTAGATAHAVAAHGRSVVVLRVRDVPIGAGAQTTVTGHLPASVAGDARRGGLGRLAATLHLVTHRGDGTVTASAQRLWLNTSPLLGCRSPAGLISTTGIGVMKLGMTHAAVRALGLRVRTRGRRVTACISGAPMQIVFPSASTLAHLSAARRRALRDRALIALTASRHYAIDGVRVGTRLAPARATLHLGRPIADVGDDWYLVAAGRGAWILRVRHRVVIEIGVANRELLHSTTLRRRLLGG